MENGQFKRNTLKTNSLLRSTQSCRLIMSALSEWIRTSWLMTRAAEWVGTILTDQVISKRATSKKGHYITDLDI